MLSSTASYNMMMTMIKPILVAVLALVAQVQGAAVGDKMAVEGYVMDQYCLDLGVLMDNPTVRSLEGPDVHSLHCLIDLEACAMSNYVILVDPADGETSYSVGYVLDNSTKAMVIAAGQQVGSCETCASGFNDSMLKMGLRVAFEAEITALGNGTMPVVMNTSAITVTSMMDHVSGDGTMNGMDMSASSLMMGTMVLLVVGSSMVLGFAV